MQDRSTRLSSLIAIAIAALVVLSSTARSQINYIAQERSVSAVAGLENAKKSQEWLGIGIFNADVEVFGKNGIGEPDSYARATQYSVLSPTEIFIQGTAEGIDNYGSGGAGIGLGTSAFNVVFNLDSPVEYTFNYNANPSYNLFNGCNYLWELTGPSFSFKIDATSPLPLKGTLNGTLMPGPYSFVGYLTDGYEGYSTGAGKGNFTFELVIPSPSTGVLLMGLLFANTVRRRR